jgi:hypothetical protein
VVSHRCARFGIASSFEATRQTVSTLCLWPVANRKNRSLWLTLKNRVFFRLWIAALLSVCCVSTHDTAASRIHVAGITTDLWTPTKFLSKRPVENAFGVVETLKLLSPRVAAPRSIRIILATSLQSTLILHRKTDIEINLIAVFSAATARYLATYA